MRHQQFQAGTVKAIARAKLAHACSVAKPSQRYVKHTVPHLQMQTTALRCVMYAKYNESHRVAPEVAVNLTKRSVEIAIDAYNCGVFLDSHAHSHPCLWSHYRVCKVLRSSHLEDHLCGIQ